MAELNKYSAHHKADRVRSMVLHLAADVPLVLVEDEKDEEAG